MSSSKRGSKERQVAAPAVQGEEKKKRRRKKKESFTTYIYKVLKQVHPDHSISKKAMTILNTFVYDQIDRLSTSANDLIQVNKTKTIGQREIQTATRLILPAELNKFAVQEATKALEKFNSSKPAKQ